MSSFYDGCGGSCDGSGSGSGASRSFDETSRGGGGAKTSRGIVSRINGFEIHFVGRAGHNVEFAGRSVGDDGDTEELETALWHGVSRPACCRSVGSG